MQPRKHENAKKRTKKKTFPALNGDAERVALRFQDV